MHTCMARFKNDRPTELVQKSLLVDLRISPSSIQGNAVLAAMRSQMPWEEVINVVSKVTSKKGTSNEKIKQPRRGSACQLG